MPCTSVRSWLSVAHFYLSCKIDGLLWVASVKRLLITCGLQSSHSLVYNGHVECKIIILASYSNLLATQESKLGQELTDGQLFLSVTDRKKTAFEN